MKISKKIVLLTNGSSETSVNLIHKFYENFSDILIITTNNISDISIKDYAKYFLIKFLNSFKKYFFKQITYNYTFPNKNIKHFVVKNINSLETFNLVAKFNPNILCISGTKKIDNTILGLSKICLNLHNGYVPLYRGVSSTDWVTFEENYDFYFSTIHEAIKELDAGKILSSQNIKPYLFEDYKSFKRRLHLNGNDLFIKTIIKIDELEFIKQTKKIKSRNLKHSHKPDLFLNTVNKNFNSINSKKYRLYNSSLREKLLYSILNFNENFNENFLNGLYILNYHDFIFEKLSKNKIKIPNIFTYYSVFEDQVNYLKQYFEIISMKKALKIYHSKLINDKKYLVITIDDGFKSIKKIIKFLNSLNIIPTIFLNTDPIIHNKPLHNHKNYLISKYIAGKKYFDLKKYFYDYECLLKGIQIKDKNFKNFILGNYLDSKDINEIKNICEFGSHTSSHIPLNNLNYDIQKKQIKNSHDNLQKLLKVDLNYFAYPFGVSEKRDFKSEFIASETSKYNFSCDGGININKELKLNLSRISIHNENPKQLKKLLLKQFYK